MQSISSGVLFELQRTLKPSKPHVEDQADREWLNWREATTPESRQSYYDAKGMNQGTDLNEQE